MANLLENLAGGLRSAAGVLSPRVQEQTFAADERAKAMAEQHAFETQRMQQQFALQQATPQTQMQRQQLENETNFRKAAAEAGGDETKIVSAAMQFGKPEIAVSIVNAKEQRAAAAERAKDANETRRLQIEGMLQNQALSREQKTFFEQQRDETTRRGQDLQRAAAEDRAALGRMALAMRPAKQERMIPVEQADGSVVYTPESAAAGGRVPKKGGADGKPLPTKLQNDLIEKGQILDASERFTKTFKDDYGGFVSDVVGNATLAAERKLSSDTGRPQWWQDYELHQSQVRNKLFGSALTAPEIAAWEKSAIGPGMNPKQIKANLARRETIERQGLTRMARSSGASYNKTAIEEAIGRPIPDAETAAPASSGDGWTVKEKK